MSPKYQILKTPSQFDNNPKGRIRIGLPFDKKPRDKIMVWTPHKQDDQIYSNLCYQQRGKIRSKFNMPKNYLYTTTK